ncbi:MAG: FAD-binding protein [Coriobacteriales bacterium]|jgi:fumarate reductase flavoprotein subunit|nr:FAD-binding protein [Coriobacteriales bacterium]
MTSEFDRRNFLKGVGLVGGVAALGAFAGCSPAPPAEDGPGGSTDADAKAEDGTKSSAGTGVPADMEPVGSYTADICIMGSGISGLAAAVQACQNGLSVVVLEKQGGTGGGGRGTEGVFGVGSTMQKQAGIAIEPVEVIGREMGYHHNRTDGLRWLDMIRASGPNIDWLAECGVAFTGVVDNYHGGEFETFHWFDESRGAKNYAPQMTATAEGLGAKILVNTAAKKLLTDASGAVTGVIAQKKAEDGSPGDYIQVNSKAVLLCGGGFANNNEYLSKGHFSNVENVVRFLSGFDGDGLTMALEVGGTDTIDRFAGLFQLTVSGAPGGEYGTFGSGNGLVVGSHSGNNIWVQETGERYCAENSGDENWMALMTPTQVHEDFYSVFTRAQFEENVRNIQFPAEAFEDDIAQFEERFATNPYDDAFVADSIEELAALASAAFPKIKKETLVETIEHYNEMCAAGADTDFGKPATYLVPMTEGPFYFIRQIQACMVTFGGIHVNRNMECIKDDWSVIPGLYSAGVDSADLWPNVYTINVPGGTNGNNVNSGRLAADNATAFIGDAKTGSIVEDGDTSPSVVVWDGGAMPASLKDGTYTSSPTQGMFGTVTATVTVSGGKITEIAETNELETGYVGVTAMDDVLIPAIIEAQDVHVDTVAGATASSNALRKAVLEALGQAG